MRLFQTKANVQARCRKGGCQCICQACIKLIDITCLQFEKASNKYGPVLAAMCLKCTDEVIGNHLSAAAFYHVALYHMHKLAIFKECNSW